MISLASTRPSRCALELSHRHEQHGRLSRGASKSAERRQRAGSTVSTRGIYTNDAARGYMSAYDDNARPGRTPPRNGGVSSTRVRGCPGGFHLDGALITVASRRPYGCRASIRTSASWTCAAFARQTPGITRRGGRTTRVASAAALELGRREGQELDVRALSNCRRWNCPERAGASAGRPMKKDSELNGR